MRCFNVGVIVSLIILISGIYFFVSDNPENIKYIREISLLWTGYIGAFIGNAFRLYLLPDMNFTNDRFFIKRIFFAEGIQVAGFFLVYFIVLKTFL